MAISALLIGLAGLATAADAPGPVFGRGSEGVLLVHDDGGSPEDFGTLGPHLAERGFLVLAPLSSPGGRPDLTASVQWLTDRGATTVQLVGFGHGANRALAAASRHPAIAATALVSPRLHTPGVSLAEAIDGYGSRALLVVAARDDRGSARASAVLHGQARGPRHLELYPGSARGDRLMNTTPGLEPLVVAWLEGHARHSAPPPVPARSVKTGEVGEIETHGQRLDVRRR